MHHEIEITLPDGTTQTLSVAGRVEIGREGTDLVLNDPAVSRRHVAVEPAADRLLVTDLGSSHGTFVDGHRITEPVQVPDGGVIAVGDTRITVRVSGPAPTDADGDRREAGATVAPRPVPAAPPPVRPAVALPDAEEIGGGGIVVRFVPGTVGAGVAGSVHDIAKRARKSLAGLGSEPWGTPIIVNVVDPFPDPADPNRVITGGSVIDAEGNTVWLVVAPESPPEDPHRALALVFGAVLPAADEFDHLLEGYGLHLAGLAEPAPEEVAALGTMIDDLEPEVRAPMAASFVRYLIAREGEGTFRQLLTAQSAQVSEAWKQLYGRSAAELEAGWRAERGEVPSEIRSGEFLRMSWRYLRPYRGRQAEVFVYMLFSLAFTASYPFVTKRLFDTAIPSGEMSQVLSLLGFLAVAFAISLLAGLRQSYVSAYISGSVVRDLRQELFGRLQRVPDSWVGRHPQGDVLSRMMNDVGRVEAGLSTAIDTGVFQGISLVVSTVIMLRVNLLLGAIVLIGAPIVALVYRQMSGGARERSLAVQEESGAVLNVAAENYQANAVVKLFGLAAFEERRFRRASDRLFRAQQRLSLFGGLFGLSVESIVTALRLLVLGLGTWLIFEGHFTLGGLVAFLGIMGEVLAPITGLTTLGQSIQASVGALIRIDEVLDADTEPEGSELPALAPLATAIRLEGVSLSYTPERRALDEVDVTIPAGTRVAFVGPSGSGKSTVLRILMRLYEPDEGRLTIDGVDVAARSLESLRSQMGVVFQDSFLFDTTLRENIALGAAGATEAQILAAADAAEIDAFVDSLPRGYDSLVGEGGRNLSGGQRQRVAIARALVGDPRILLLDEATSALDPQTERQISATLERAGAGKTVIAITHRLTSITDYDLIYVVAGGRIAESGRHDELVARGGVYARLWSEQTGAPMPAEAPFDLAGVLSRLPLFVNLESGALAEVVDRFEPRILEPGDVVAEGGEHLAVVAAGRGEILAGDDGVEGPPLREVGAGDVFGLNALLGQPTGTVLRAAEPLSLQVLSGNALAELRARHHEIAEGQSGRATLAIGPQGRIVPRSRRTTGRSTVAVDLVAGRGTRGLSASDVAAAVAAARRTSEGPGQTR